MLFAIILLAVAVTKAAAAPVLLSTLESRAIGPIGLLINDFVATPSVARPSPTETSATTPSRATTATTEDTIHTAPTDFDYAAHAVGAAGIAGVDADAPRGSIADPDSGAPDAFLLTTIQAAPTSTSSVDLTAHLSTTGVADTPLVASLAPPRIGTVEFPSAGPL